MPSGLSPATPSADVGALVSAAEKIVAGRFVFRGSEVNLEGCMDWNLSAGVDPDWRRDLNRLEWANTLLLAGHYCGDGRYAKRAAGLLLDWQRRNPPGSAPWRDTFEVAQRDQHAELDPAPRRGESGVQRRSRRRGRRRSLFERPLDRGDHRVRHREQPPHRRGGPPGAVGHPLSRVPRRGGACAEGHSARRQGSREAGLDRRRPP